MKKRHASYFFVVLLLSCSAKPRLWEAANDFDGGCTDLVDCDGDGSDNDYDSETDADTGHAPCSTDDLDCGTDENPDTGSSTDTKTETDSETGGDLDGGTDTGGKDDSDTEDDSDTGTDTEQLSCPWDCRQMTGTDPYTVCDSDTDDPTSIQNHNFSCEIDGFCCQPIDDESEGAIVDHCPGVCNEWYNCADGVDLDHYCNNSSIYCCAS